VGEHYLHSLSKRNTLPSKRHTFPMNREFRQDCCLRVNILSECAQADVRSAVAEKVLLLLKNCRCAAAAAAAAAYAAAAAAAQELQD